LVAPSPVELQEATVVGALSALSDRDDSITNTQHAVAPEAVRTTLRD
jgi:hypothetical protein